MMTEQQSSLSLDDVLAASTTPAASYGNGVTVMSAALEVGRRVRVIGLRREDCAKYNGEAGITIGELRDKARQRRIVVKLDCGDEINVKLENLT